MKINLKIDTESKWKEISVEPGISLLQIAKEYADPEGLPMLAVKVNHVPVDLQQSVTEECCVEFLDIRDQGARLIYEHSLIMVYLKAVEMVLGRTHVEVRNALGKGVYTEIAEEESISDEQLQAVKDCMCRLVAEDMAFKKITMSREKGLQVLQDAGLYEKKRWIAAQPDLQVLHMYELDGFVNFFYSLMLPSTGYLYDFDLRKYRKGILLMYSQQNSLRSEPEFFDDRKLYATFQEARKWQVMQDIYFVGDLNYKIREGEAVDMILLSEALQQKRIVEITKQIVESGKRVVLITGPSSSGKTTFARKLCIQLRVEGVEPLYMGTDDYFVNREDTPLDENGEPNYEDLEAVDIDMFNSHINRLLKGDEVDLPIFDFLEGRKVFGKRKTKITKHQPMVIEGIHALNDKLTPSIDDGEKFRIYISPLTPLGIDAHNRISVTDARMLRRMVRDYNYRGHSAEETIREWPKVRRGENKNVFPYNGKADVFFNSGHLYEIGLLKKYAEPLLEAISSDAPEYGEAIRMLQFLRFFNTIEDDGLVPNDSIIREFIGGSVFVKQSLQ